MSSSRVVILVVSILLLIGTVTSVRAMPDPFATLTVWPYETPEGAEGPIVATSPADLIIYNNDNSHILDDVWLMLIVNQAAYNHLISISTNTSLSFLPEHFQEIPGTSSPDERIPPYASDSAVTPSAPYAYRPAGWPGVEPSDQYNVGSLRSVMGIVSGQSMYYSVGDLDSSTNWMDHGPLGLNKEDPEYFTLTVSLDGPAEGWKVLVLALGHTNDWPDDHILNVHSPYTRSTFVVSELGSIFLTLASISALGLYGIRRKLKSKPARASAQ